MTNEQGKAFAAWWRSVPRYTTKEHDSAHDAWIAALAWRESLFTPRPVSPTPTADEALLERLTVAALGGMGDYPFNQDSCQECANALVRNAKATLSAIRAAQREMREGGGA